MEFGADPFVSYALPEHTHNLLFATPPTGVNINGIMIDLCKMWCVRPERGPLVDILDLESPFYPQAGWHSQPSIICKMGIK